MSYAHQSRPAHSDRPHRWRRPLAVAAAVATALTGVTGLAGAASPTAATDRSAPPAAAAIPDLTSANRRAPIAGLPDWSKAGYRGGAALPGAAEANPDAACHITAAELASQYGVRADGSDATTGLQRAVDAIRTNCTPSAGYTKLSSITLPAGRIVVTRQLALDADYMVLRGAGMGQTTLAFRPDADTRYDTLTADGSDWDEDGMTHGAGKGGWTWPGRGLLRVQTREVSPRYARDFASAPANRKDIFEGSVNQHWASGVPLREGPAVGATQIKLATNADMLRFKVGAHLWVGAANTARFYQQQTVTDASKYVNLHMRQQIFQIASVDTAGRNLRSTATTAGGGGPVVDVSTAAQLRSALANAQPGQTIRLAAGEYRGAFQTQKAGTASAPITLTGPADAVLVNDGPSGTGPSCPVPTAGVDTGYGLWLYGAPYWKLTGFTVKESKKGVVLDDSHHVTIDGLSVHHVDEEAVHFRRSSADGVIRNSKISHTGLVQAGYGEGVYLGSAGSNWACHGNQGGVDRSDRVQVLDNTFGPKVAAEHIDIKEGTSNGVIRGNTFDGTGISGQNSADSWTDAKGIGYLIENNTGTFSSPGTFANGYETHNPSTSPSFLNGCGNVWRGNRSDLGGVGAYAIKITSTSKCGANPNVVYASNTVTNAGSGLTNVPVTP
ncbi:right-handed parallel beta-helix repeat-containing protein [Streptomyces sp. NPDC047981]|uniref:right-handed parallel beta-helix repeat-containing protein n=1 Tax=Streptomyces sp. NPDC047981 TaxID=3154610 RepID=UPI00343791B4